jgi:hypothetical protein
MTHNWPDTGHVAQDAAPVRLTRAQWWDLAGIFTAGVVSSGLIVAALLPIVMPRPPARGKVAASRPAVKVASMFVEASITAPALASASPATPAPRPRVVRAASNSRPPETTASRTSQPVTRKLARLITGNGRHAVRPFPIVEDDQP